MTEGDDHRNDHRSDFDEVDFSRVNRDIRRVDDAASALEVAAVEGVVIITGVEPGPRAARRLAWRIFGDRALAVPESAMVREGGEMDRRPDGLDHTTRSKPHTDGYSYGDECPDYFLLSCEYQSEAGGESLMLDGYALLEALAGHPGLAWLTEGLSTRVIDQTEPGKRLSHSTIVQTTPSGRRMLRRTADQVPLIDSDDPERDAEMIRLWKMAIDRAADAVEPSERPKLRAGEAVLVDNYRMFHGREAYADLERLMWRVWIWSDEAKGVPEGMLHSDSRFAAQL